MKRLASLALAAACAAVACPASAQFAKPEDAVKYRQSALFVMASTSAASAPWPTAACPTTPAAAVGTPKSWPRWPSCPGPASAPGTEGGKAKPEIWKEQAKFKEHSEKLVAETGKLVAAAKTSTWIS